jgi:hypothetical protein
MALRRGRNTRHVRDPTNLPRLLRPARDRRGERPSQRGQQEAAAVHARAVGRMATQSGSQPHHPMSRISASAFSSQYVMPMSRYIVVAVVSRLIRHRALGS